MTKTPSTPPQAPPESDLDAIFEGVMRRGEPSSTGIERAREASWQQWLATVQARKSRRSKRLLAAVAAVAVLALGVSILLRPTGPEPLRFEVAQGTIVIDQSAYTADSGTVSIAPNTALTAPATTRLLSPGGAELRVRAGTEMTWIAPGQLSLATGEVYIDTHERSDMVIATPFGTVADIGTRYQVGVTDHTLTVAVRSGAATIETPTQVLTARAGPQRAAIAVLQSGAPAQQFQEPASASRWQWIHDAAPGYQSQRVHTALADIAEDMGLALQYASPGDQATLANATQSGDLSGFAPTRALQALARAGALNWQVMGTELIIEVQP